MVAPRVLVFQPLVKGNEDSGNEIELFAFFSVGCTWQATVRFSRGSFFIVEGKKTNLIDDANHMTAETILISKEYSAAAMLISVS